MARPKRASDDETWADRHEGECLSGSIHELRESSPPGKPFEPPRGTLGFLEWADKNTLRSPQASREKRSRRRKRK